MTYKERIAFFYKKARAENCKASTALRKAKYGAMYGKGTKKDRIVPYTGDTEITTLPNGWHLKVEIEYDSDAQAPWKTCDGMGVIKECSENPGEAYEAWILSQRQGWYRYYDWKATLPEAVKDGWDAAPYGVGTKRERAMRAMKSTYEYLHRWCNSDWYYVGLIVTLLDEDDNEIAEDSCWGYESDADADAYICSEARSWASSMIRKARKTEREARRNARVNSRFADAMACGV